MLARARIPNYLTFARVAAVPVCLVLMLVAPQHVAALLWIFIAASLTDFLDGYLARKWNVVSALGALLDPIADKLLVALMLIYLTTQPAFSAVIFAPVAIILLRELYISGLREFLAKRSISLPVSSGGKWKTAMQMIAITLLLAHPVYPAMVPAIAGVVLLYLSALLAFTSALQYTRASWVHLRG